MEANCRSNSCGAAFPLPDSRLPTSADGMKNPAADSTSTAASEPLSSPSGWAPGRKLQYLNWRAGSKSGKSETFQPHSSGVFLDDATEVLLEALKKNGPWRTVFIVSWLNKTGVHRTPSSIFHSVCPWRLRDEDLPKHVIVSGHFDHS